MSDLKDYAPIIELVSKLVGLLSDSIRENRTVNDTEVTAEANKLIEIFKNKIKDDDKRVDYLKGIKPNGDKIK